MHAHAPTPPHAGGPRLIAWELTRSCTLHCRHCRAAAQAEAYSGELAFEEVQAVVDSVAGAGYSPIMILTGGEPMLRPDLLDIIRYIRDRGLRPVIATCGHLLTPERAGELREAGIERLSVSLDGPDAASHDTFRGVDGAWEATMRGVDACTAAGLAFQVNTTVTRTNVGDLQRILDRAVGLGAVAFHPFLLVPTGRGANLRDDVLDAEEYEAVLNRIYEMSREAPIPFKPTCAPHYYRVLRQREQAEGRAVTPQTHGLDAMSKGCMGGVRFAFISHVGQVQICGFLDESAGDLRAADLDFARVWEQSPLFKAVRDKDRYSGDCGVCGYWQWCGGCRARAFAVAGDYLASEPFCAYVPPANRGPGA
jgi:heme b synthase